MENKDKGGTLFLASVEMTLLSGVLTEGARSGQEQHLDRLCSPRVSGDEMLRPGIS